MLKNIIVLLGNRTNSSLYIDNDTAESNEKMSQIDKDDVYAFPTRH